MHSSRVRYRCLNDDVAEAVVNHKNYQWLNCEKTIIIIVMSESGYWNIKVAKLKEQTQKLQVSIGGCSHLQLSDLLTNLRPEMKLTNIS